MITIPLAPTFAFLARHDADGALEGAPFSMGGTILGAWNGRPYATAGDIPPRYALYLGDGDVCPAALGWATAVIVAAVGRDLADGYAINFDCQDVDLYQLGAVDPCFWWAWRFDEDRSQQRQNLVKPTPATPAARLRAVLLHEMGRAC